ncbi:phosphotransferase [Thalassomonas viridans]|uniref:Phosphotransferase n=1 Tax=Thalassomonas viridans TaxID=137584 RepID=A0AAE9Z0L7_9GAMM|nr:aminoglycoside phosphotransferase family protein [Thalassomonas viridans]WDE04631.1 phosphotransferase [Thalassomonas viridans]
MMAQALTPLFEPEALLAQMRGQRWFAQQDLEDGSVEILDWLELADNGENQQVRLYWLKVRVGASHNYSVLFSEHDGMLQDASQHSAFIRLLKQAGDKGLATANGGVICLQGDILREVITRISPFDGGSSNSLQLCETENHSYVLKCYRLMTAGNNDEVAVLKALQPHRVMPAPAGVIGYHRPEGDREYLGLITPLLSGEPVHKLFSRSIRQVMAQTAINSSESLAADIEKHRQKGAAEYEIQRQKLEPLCRKVGEQIARFHHHLNAAYPGQSADGDQGFDLTAYLEQGRNRWQRIRRAVAKDPQLDPDCREKVLAQLHLCGEHLLDEASFTGLAGEQGKLPMSVVHGDLHLAHVFIGEESQQACQIIDPSPVSLNHQDPAFNTQVSLMDVAGFHRGLEYFSFDEVTHVMAERLAKSNTGIAALLLQQPEQPMQACPALFSLLERWSSEVFSFLFDAYREQAGQMADSGSQGDKRIYRLFYFNRLLKELDYNYAYGRQFFKLCDLYYLNKLTDILKP